MNDFQAFMDKSEWSVPILLLLVVWTIFWKGAALWYAARKKEKLWFTVLLIINTLGILEIIYLLVLRKQSIKNLYK